MDNELADHLSRNRASSFHFPNPTSTYLSDVDKALGDASPEINAPFLREAVPSSPRSFLNESSYRLVGPTSHPIKNLGNFEGLLTPTFPLHLLWMSPLFLLSAIAVVDLLVVYMTYSAGIWCITGTTPEWHSQRYLPKYHKSLRPQPIPSVKL